MKQPYNFAVFFGLVSALAHAQNHEMSVPVEKDDVSASQCGVLGSCNEKTLHFSCESNTGETMVVVKECDLGKSSLVSGTANFCVGSSRKVSLSSFRRHIENNFKNSLNESEKQILKSIESGSNEGTCKDEEILAVLKNQRSILLELGSETSVRDLNYKIYELEKNIEKKKKICTYLPDKVSQAFLEIPNVEKDICSKSGLKLAKLGTALHSLIKDYDPSASPCEGEKSCAESIESRLNGEIGKVVKRDFGSDGQVLRWRKDKFSNLTWSPASTELMTEQEGKAYCAARTDLGKKWRLPKADEAYRAFWDGKPGPRSYVHSAIAELGYKNRTSDWTVYASPVFVEGAEAPSNSFQEDNGRYSSSGPRYFTYAKKTHVVCVAVN